MSKDPFDQFERNFNKMFVGIVVANILFWGGLIALGFYAVNKFAG